MSFDYNAPAELFLSKRAKDSRIKYRRFATAAEALRYATEELRTPQAFGAWLDVGDERFNGIEIQRLYDADDYPLRKSQETERMRASRTERGPLPSKTQKFETAPDLQKRAKGPKAPHDLSAHCVLLTHVEASKRSLLEKPRDKSGSRLSNMLPSNLVAPSGPSRSDATLRPP